MNEPSSHPRPNDRARSIVEATHETCAIARARTARIATLVARAQEAILRSLNAIVESETLLKQVGTDARQNRAAPLRIEDDKPMEETSAR